MFDNAPNLGPLISHEEAAGYLGIPAATLHQWNSKGVGPRSYKIGRHRKYRAGDLEVFIEARASDVGLADA